MTTKYRIVRQVNDRGFENSHEFAYSIQKKYWFGWKEVDWHFLEEKAMDILYTKFVRKQTEDEIVHEVEV